jgi:hypothetical protein
MIFILAIASILALDYSSQHFIRWDRYWDLSPLNVNWNLNKNFNRNWNLNFYWSLFRPHQRIPSTWLDTKGKDIATTNINVRKTYITKEILFASQTISRDSAQGQTPGQSCFNPASVPHPHAHDRAIPAAPGTEASWAYGGSGNLQTANHVAFLYQGNRRSWTTTKPLNNRRSAASKTMMNERRFQTETTTNRETDH